MEHTGNQLRKAIKEKGLTQEKAAEKLGITRQTIGQWLKRPVFDANTLHEISSKLGVELGAKEDQNSDNISLPREIFNKLSQLIDTVTSQQNTISDQNRIMSRLVEDNHRILSIKYPDMEADSRPPIVSDAEKPYQE